MERRTRVLIGDDKVRSRDGLRALLATWPEIEVIGEAVDGEETVNLVEVCPPDVVLIDARMPVMDGLEATRLIKSRWPEVRVVVLTMYPAYRTEALAAGADGFLIKGCSPDDLLDAIRGGDSAVASISLEEACVA
jgi:DNA-binding NarL/FixJ family response regulator